MLIPAKRRGHTAAAIGSNAANIATPTGKNAMIVPA